MSGGHTPGPWRLSQMDDTLVVDEHGREIASATGDYSNAAIWPVMEANARLIAAAPELLASLTELLDIIDQGDIRQAWEAAKCQARAAIAKAAA